MKYSIRKSTDTSIPLTILTGAVLGFVTTLLIAPKKGDEFRKWLVNRLKIRSAFSENGVDQSTADVNSRVNMYSFQRTNRNETTSKAASMVSHLKEQAKNGHHHNGQS